MDDDPTVTVGHPEVPDYTDPSVRVEMDDLLFVDGSACGPVTDYDDTRTEARHRLQQIAKRHADEVHDGLVQAEGWAR